MFTHEWKQTTAHACHNTQLSNQIPAIPHSHHTAYCHTTQPSHRIPAIPHSHHTAYCHTLAVIPGTSVTPGYDVTPVDMTHSRRTAARDTRSCCGGHTVIMLCMGKCVTKMLWYILLACFLSCFYCTAFMSCITITL